MDGTLVIASDVRFFGKIYPKRPFILLSSLYTTNSGPYHLCNFMQSPPPPPPAIPMARNAVQCWRPWSSCLLTGCAETKIQEHVGLKRKFCCVKSERILHLYIKKVSLTGWIFLKFRIYKGKSVYIMKYHLSVYEVTLSAAL